MSTVLAVSTRALLDACSRLGLDATAIARRAGVDPASIAGAEARLETALADAVWREALAAAGDPALALHAAEAVPDGAYRVLDYAAAASATVGEALRRVAAYFRIVGHGALVVDEAAQQTTLRLEGPAGRALAAPAQEYTLAAVYLRVRRGCGGSWVPARVSLTVPAPASIDEHVRVFGVAPEFGAPAAELVIARRDRELPSARADAALASILDAHARDLVERLPAEHGLAARVADAIGAELSGGDPSVARIARVLGTTERTLQRRLRDEGSGFAEILDGVRERYARTYLRRPDVALAEVAWLLGFADQSAFTRAFRRWTGETPARFRARMLARA